MAEGNGQQYRFNEVERKTVGDLQAKIAEIDAQLVRAAVAQTALDQQRFTLVHQREQLVARHQDTVKTVAGAHGFELEGQTIRFNPGEMTLVAERPPPAEAAS